MTSSMPTPRLIKEIRDRAGYTQEALAHELGVSFPTVNIWERGHREPRASWRRKIEELAAEHGVRQDLSMLIIEDNLVDCEYLVHRIRGTGVPADIAIATNGTDGLLLCGSMRPDIVFIDIRMPGMDGIEVAERLNHISGLDECRVVFVTSLDDERQLARARATGATAILQKPVPAKELTLIIKAVAALAKPEETEEVSQDAEPVAATV